MASFFQNFRPLVEFFASGRPFCQWRPFFGPLAQRLKDSKTQRFLSKLAHSFKFFTNLQVSWRSSSAFFRRFETPLRIRPRLWTHFNILDRNLAIFGIIDHHRMMPSVYYQFWNMAADWKNHRTDSDPLHRASITNRHSFDVVIVTTRLSVSFNKGKGLSKTCVWITTSFILYRMEIAFLIRCWLTLSFQKIDTVAKRQKWRPNRPLLLFDYLTGWSFAALQVMT